MDLKQKMNYSKYLFTIGVVFLAGVCPAAVAIKNTRCEYLVNPLGVDTTSPRLSWTITSDQRGEMQTAYQVLVASSSKILKDDKGDLWDSGQVASDESSQIAYSGSPLESRQ